MNIKIPDSWLREFIQTNATPFQIKECLSLCGPTIEKITKLENDFVYEIELTSNRIDMASVYGIAREAKVILPRFKFEANLNSLKIKSPPPPTSNMPLIIKDPNFLCHRILAVVLKEVEIRPSPIEISSRLEKCGIRSLNNLIDITNYVMLEIGHPCHVFDYDRIKTNKLIIRKAKKNEKLITLDNKVCKLNEEDVIIDDGTGRVVDLPGIIGTENSVVTETTKNIIFFTESNNPQNIRRTSMRLGLRTVAATINEKRPDPSLAKSVLLRGIYLYQTLAKAKMSSKIFDIYPKPTKPKTISTTIDFINNRLGIKLTKQEIISILKSLEFKVSDDNNIINVTPCSYRQFDVTIPEDIVEEVARIYGYHNLPSKLMTGEIPISPKSKNIIREEKIKTMLKYWGYTETYHYSFISKELILKTNLNLSDHIKIANPLTAEHEYMRLSLIPSMLLTIKKNCHQYPKLNLFELAKVYRKKKNNLPDEISNLVVVTYEGFFQLKNVIEKICQEFGITNFQLKKRNSPIFQPNQYIEYHKNGVSFVSLGKLSRNLLDDFEIVKDYYLAEMNIEYLGKIATFKRTYIPIAKYPPVIEDLALVVGPSTYIGEVIQEIKKVSYLIKNVNILDSYKNIRTLRISYQDENRNLSSQDILPLRKKIIAMLRKKYQINLKKEIS